jgi:hypothetical protein
MKFQKTYCSQCGGEFGAGEEGFSSCADHTKGNRMIDAMKQAVEALELAVRQNSHDMVMTGDELRTCEAALAKARRTE